MIKIFQLIIILLILYIFLVSNIINRLFQSILGRVLIFSFVIIMTFINKTLGFILASYLLVCFNDVLVTNYIPFHNQNVENYYNSNDTSSINFDIITEKINIEKLLQPKKSMDLFSFSINKSNKEPKPFSF